MSNAVVDDTQVTTRHKGKLAKIREERALSHAIGREDSTGNSRVDLDTNGSPDGAGERTGYENGDYFDQSGNGAQGIESEPGIDRRSRSGVRPLDGSNEHATGYDDSMVREPENASLIESPAPTPTPLDMEAEKERKRELDRQRKARQRAKEKDAKGVHAQNADEWDTGRDVPDTRNVPPLQSSDMEHARFKVKDIFAKASGVPDEVKTFTIAEAEENLEKLLFIYMKGSELLDDVLEIVVRGHEAVRIWALDEDEARMLAVMQMERAKKDKAAARVVRVMLKLYERIYVFLLVAPRLKATGSHIKEQGGFSFR